jgi:hypothetical protein
MSREGYPNLGEAFTGFLHRHPARPGFPEMKKHVVVDLEDWIIARESHCASKENNTAVALGSAGQFILLAVEGGARASEASRVYHAVNAVLAQSPLLPNNGINLDQGALGYSVACPTCGAKRFINGSQPEKPV